MWDFISVFHASYLLISFWSKFQLNLGVYIADGKSELSILVDHAVGGSSIEDGEIEIMLHRFISLLLVCHDFLQFSVSLMVLFSDKYC